MYECVCVYVRAFVCEYECVRARVCCLVWVYVCACVHERACAIALPYITRAGNNFVVGSKY